MNPSFPRHHSYIPPSAGGGSWVSMLLKNFSTIFLSKKQATPQIYFLFKIAYKNFVGCSFRKYKTIFSKQLYPNKMLSIEECKKIINAKEKGLTDEQVKQIRDWFYFWADIEISKYKKKIQSENEKD